MAVYKRPVIAGLVLAFLIPGAVACSDPDVERCVEKVRPIQERLPDFDINNLRDTCKKMKELSKQGGAPF